MAKVTRLSLDGSGGLDRRRLHLREISDESDAPLDTVGQDLRKARQRKGEDLAQISRALKIRKDHLEAIEESNMDALPGRAYAIGFVRSYAEYLGLDPGRCVAQLKAEIAGREEEKSDNVNLSPPGERKLPPGALVFVLLLLIALVYGVYYLISAAERFQSQPVTPVPQRLAAQVDPPSAAVPAIASPVEPVTSAEAPSGTGPDVPAVTTPASAAAAVLPEGQQLGLGNTNSRIMLRIHRQARVTVLGAGERTYLDRTLNPGDTYAAPNLTGLTISASDAGAVELVLDGSSAGFLGGDGMPATNLSLNPQAIVDRRRPG